MKQIAAALWMALSLLLLAGCGAAPDVGADHSVPAEQQSEAASTPIETDAPEVDRPENPDTEMTITLTVGSQTFSAALSDNETARQFAELLPLTLDMSELNGNEKYFYMDYELPTDSQRPGQINAGDLMLYGDNCLVLFYETFSSSYSYTRIGSVNDPTGLAAALGGGSVIVTLNR